MTQERFSIIDGQFKLVTEGPDDPTYLLLMKRNRGQLEFTPIEERLLETHDKLHEIMLTVAKQPQWIPVTERLPTAEDMYPAYSNKEQRSPPCDWMDALCVFDPKANDGKGVWQHSSGFYDHGITHWLELSPQENRP